MESPIKNWRNNKGDTDKLIGYGVIDDNAQTVNDDSLTFSTYFLVALTIVVIALILNWCRKGRNNIRTRRKYFLLNKLGI